MRGLCQACLWDGSRGSAIHSSRFTPSLTSPDLAATLLAPTHHSPFQEGHPQSLGTFVAELTKMCNDCGMRTSLPPIVHFDRSYGVGVHVSYAIEQATEQFKKKWAARHTWGRGGGGVARS